MAASFLLPTARFISRAEKSQALPRKQTEKSSQRDAGALMLTPERLRQSGEMLDFLKCPSPIVTPLPGVAFSSFPNAAHSEGGQRDIAFPDNAETRNMIEQSVLAEYEKVVATSEPVPSKTNYIHHSLHRAILGDEMALKFNSMGAKTVQTRPL